MSAPRSKVTDRNAEQVHASALQMGNLGLSRVADLLVSRVESGVWRDFSDGIGRYRFLPGEFDYFRAQQGVTRDHVIHGVQDVEVKARLEQAMDERRTGEADYRRRLTDVRQQIPQRPGRKIEPFGYTIAEARQLGIEDAQRREALGRSPRQWNRTGGTTTKRPSETVPRAARIARSLTRLSDEELDAVIAAASAEHARRLPS